MESQIMIGEALNSGEAAWALLQYVKHETVFHREV